MHKECHTREIQDHNTYDSQYISPLGISYELPFDKPYTPRIDILGIVIKESEESKHGDLGYNSLQPPKSIQYLEISDRDDIDSPLLDLCESNQLPKFPQGRPKKRKRTIAESIAMNISLQGESFAISPRHKTVLHPPETQNLDDTLKTYFFIREKTDYEKIDDMNDNWLFIDFRKAICRIYRAFRELCQIIVSSSLFEGLIILVILINSIVLALEDPNENYDNDSVYIILEHIFLYIYTAEAFLKISAMGFIRDKDSYIKDWWNIMDFSIVLISWIIELIEGGVNLSAFRIFRILRPLRSISSIQGLRVIFLALINSLSMLLNSVILLIFFFFVFAIAGLQLWMGQLKYRCMDVVAGVMFEDLICGNKECTELYECSKGLDNPNHGVTNFDNILYSFLVTFQCVTLEGWTDIMIMIQQAYSDYVVFYFIPLVFIGAFFLVNIMLAVLKSSFSRMMEEAGREQKINNEESINGSLIAKHVYMEIFPEIDEVIFSPEYYDRIQSPKLMAIRTRSTVGDILDLANDQISFNINSKNRSQEYFPYLDPDNYEKEISSEEQGQIKPIIQTISNIVHEMDTERQIKIKDNLQPEEHLYSIARHNTDKRIFDNQHEDNFSLESLNTERILHSAGFDTRNSRPTAIKTNVQQNSRNPFKRMTCRNPTIIRRVETIPQLSTGVQEVSPLTPALNRAQTSPVNLQTIKDLDTSHFFNIYPMIHRIKSLRIEKDIAERLKNIKQIDKVKIELSNKYEQSYDSYYDVKPLVAKTPECLSRYLFTYEETEILFKDEETSTTDKKALISSFIKLAMKMPIQEAFSFKMNLTSELVSYKRREDGLYKYVLGTWSGSDTNPNYIDNLTILKKLNQTNYRLWTNSYRGKLHYYKYPLYLLSVNKFFGIFITVCVSLNTLVLSLYYYGISDEMNQVLNNINISFTALFIAEMVIKLVGLGIKGYFKDAMNYLDGLVVTLSIVEIIFLSDEKTTFSAFSAFRAIRVFRIFRVMRVARLFRYFKSMSSIISAISASMSKFIYLAILLLIFLVIFTLVGMQLFGGKFDFPDGTPRWNFDNFQIGFITVFQVLTLENWNVVMYDAMRSDLGPVSCIYFIVWIFLGNYVILNLFLAILLDSFLQSPNQSYIEDDTKSSNSNLLVNGIMNYDSKKRREKLQKLMDELRDSFDYDSSSIMYMPQIAVPQKPLFFDIECKDSYWLFSKSNKFRILCYRISTSQRFETFILILIVLSTIKLVMDTYLLSMPGDYDIIIASNYLDILFTCAFACEMLIRSISMGFVMQKGSYLRDGWNKLDFFIVIFSIIELSISELNMPEIKVLRLLRTLRPLRFINRNISIKLVINAMIESLAALLNVGVVLVIVWLMFAILGVSLFGGKFYTCSNPNLKTRKDCEMFGNEWNTYQPNFDNIPEAYMALFIVSSGENWPNIMRNAMDVTEEDHAPIKDNSVYSAYYFIVFIIVGSFFFLNLFIGVIFERFNEAKNQEDSMLISSEFLNKTQTNWLDLQKLILNSRPQLDVVEIPTNSIRRSLYLLCNNFWFEMFILICIIFNVLQMALAYDEASHEYNQTLEKINLAFTFIFILEALIKIIGLSPFTYFRSTWNKFDFLVVLTSLADLIMTFFLGDSVTFLRTGPQLARIMRVLRVSRFIRILKSLHAIQDLLNVIVLALPATINIFSLLLLVFLIYAVLGVYLFSSVTTGSVINSYINFKNFHMAMIALFRISTGEGWNEIMYDCKYVNGYTVSAIYFGSFVTTTTFIMLNMFIMVIVQEYENYESDSENIIKTFHSYSKVFKKKWANYSAGYKGLRVYYTALIDLMYSLGEKHGGVPPETDQQKVIQILSVLNLDFDDEGFIYYNDFLFGILKWKYGKRLTKGIKDNHINKFLHQEETKTLRKLKSIRDKARAQLSDGHTSGIHHITGKNSLLITMMYARTLFRSWKNYVKKRRGVNSKANSDLSIIFDADFPGENTPLSASYHLPSKNVSPEIDEKSCKNSRLKKPTLTRSNTLISKNSKSMQQDGVLDTDKIRV